jgi:hypothetical protein
MAGPWEKYAAQPQPGFVPLTPADPLVPGKVTEQQLSIAGKRADLAKTPAEIRKLDADARKAVADAKKAESEVSTAIDPAIAQRIQDLQLDDMLHAVDQAAALIRGGGATGFTGAAKRAFLYGTDANDLSGALTTLKSNVMLDKLKELKNASPTGASGMGALSEREGQMLASVIGSFDLKQSDAKLLDSLARIRQHALSLKAIQAGKNPDDPTVQKAFGIVNPNVKATPPGGSGPSVRSSLLIGGPGQDGGGPSAMQLAQGSTMSADDPALLGIRKHVSEMVRKGASQADIDAYAQSVGAPSFDASAAIAFRDRHPEYRGGYNIAVPPKTIPMTGPRAILNSIGQSPLGAYFMGAGDVISGGTLDNLTDNPDLSRAGMAGVAALNPKATLAGQVTGGIGMSALAEAGAGRLGVQGLAKLIAGDVAPGIAYGAGSADDGNRLGGAAEGGLAGLIGGAAGRGTGRIVSGIADPATQALADRGVRLTPGRLFGGPLKRVEDTLMSYPIVGDFIRPQARRALRDANRASFGEALEPIGAVAGDQVGEAGVENALSSYSDFLNNTLGPVRLTIDPVYRSGMGRLSQAIPQIPEIGPKLAAEIEATIAPHVVNGQVTGEGFQAIDRGLNELGRAYKNDPSYGPIIRPALDAVGNEVEGLLSRQAPDVLPAYQQSKEAYKRISTLADAVNAGVNQVDNGETVFTMAQLNRAARTNAKNFGGRNAAASGRRPFYDLGRAGQEVLAQTVPDSGTAGRLFLPGALGLGGAAIGGGRGALDAPEGQGLSGAAEGGGAGALTGLATAAALTSPFALRPVLQRLMASGNSPVRRAAGNFIGASRLPGALALPLLMGGQ